MNIFLIKGFMNGKAWSFLTIAGERQYAGNEGYADETAAVYSFDSTVPNSGHVRRGDLAALRSGSGLLGIGLITALLKAPGVKQRFRCPICKTTSIKKRQNGEFAYRCSNGHFFDEPVAENVDVMDYRAEYASAWLSLPGALSVDQLEQLTFGDGRQHAIREMDAASLVELLGTQHPETRHLLSRFLQKLSPDSISDGPKGTYVPTHEDHRVNILRAIKARRGQSAFRKKLIESHGARCMISGCAVMDVVEAAHLWPYRGNKDNDLANGILLRADLHTLYDLDLIGIEPKQMRISTSPLLAGSDYADLNGKILVCGTPPSEEALELRWIAFCEALEEIA